MFLQLQLRVINAWPLGAISSQSLLFNSIIHQKSDNIFGILPNVGWLYKKDHDEINNNVDIAIYIVQVFNDYISRVMITDCGWTCSAELLHRRGDLCRRLKCVKDEFFSTHLLRGGWIFCNFAFWKESGGEATVWLKIIKKTRS